MRQTMRGKTVLILMSATMLFLADGMAFQDSAIDLDGRRDPVYEPMVEPTEQLRIGELRNGVLVELPDRLTVHFPRERDNLNPSSLELWIDREEVTEILSLGVEQAFLDHPARFIRGRGRHEIQARLADANGTYDEVTYQIVYLPPLPVNQYQWPFAYSGNEPNVVGNLMEDYQNFNGNPDEDAYWHLGLDIRAPANSMVHAVIGGTILSINQYKPSSLNWSIVIRGDDGYIWQYNHMDKGSIDMLQLQACQTIEKGDPLGRIVTWPLTFGGKITKINGHEYHHLHLNVAQWTGSCQSPCENNCSWPNTYSDGYEYYNPLTFLPNNDNMAPRGFGRIYFKPNDSNEAFAAAETVNQAIIPILGGDVDIVAQLHDRRPQSDMDDIPGQPYELGIYDLAYSIAPLNPVCGIGYVRRTRLARFDRIPGGSTVAGQDALLTQVYQQNLVFEGQLFKTLFDWDEVNPDKQVFYYTLTNSLYGQIDAEKGFWNTDSVTLQGSRFPDGEYRVTVYASDIAGNEVELSSVVTLNNGLEFSGFCPNRILAMIPMGNLILMPQRGASARFAPPPVSLRFGGVSEGSARAEIDSETWPVWYFDLPDRRIRVAVGLLEGHKVEVEYVPYLGDVILEIDAEVQILPSTGAGAPPVFDPNQPSTHPVRLRMSTRLARNPLTGDAFIGRPHRVGETGFSLVLARALDIQGVEMLLTSEETGGLEAAWQVRGGR